MHQAILIFSGSCLSCLLHPVGSSAQCFDSAHQSRPEEMLLLLLLGKCSALQYVETFDLRHVFKWGLVERSGNQSCPTIYSP